MSIPSTAQRSNRTASRFLEVPRGMDSERYAVVEGPDLPEPNWQLVTEVLGLPRVRVSREAVPEATQLHALP